MSLLKDVISLTCWSGRLGRRGRGPYGQRGQVSRGRAGVGTRWEEGQEWTALTEPRRPPGRRDFELAPRAEKQPVQRSLWGAPQEV